MPPANVFDEARDALERSVSELREQLSQAEEALEKLGGKVTQRGPGRRPGRPRRRGPGRPKGSTNKATARTGSGTTPPRKRRKRRGGTRADQAVKLIESQPGISASDVAKTMKIKPNYLYRVLGDLEKEGRVKKDGRQYYPAGG
jgi:predicted Rossmann fold nucleotide-binding protein DprA/Smf involved in DNA uptake